MVHPKPVGGYREMLLLELIELYGPVYPDGGDWQKTAEYLYAEEPEHMAILTASLEAKGWREPILLSEPDDLEEGHSPLVLNGTHRVAIALREGVISLPVVFGSEIPSMADDPFVELEISLIAGELTDEEDWKIFDILRSFQLDADIWLTSDICFGSQSSWTFCYDLQDESRFAELKRRARAMLKVAFPGRKFSLTAKLTEPEEDES